MNYKQTDITGNSWIRCNTLTVTNPLDIPELNSTTPIIKQVYFQEEKVIVLSDNKVIINQIGSISAPYISENIISILDPTTGQATGATITHADLYKILYSLYIQTAQARDGGT